jgi:hypothetical protein
LGRVVEHRRDHVHHLYDLPNGTTLAKKIVVTSIFLITEVLGIEHHKLDNTFLYVAFGLQNLLKPTSDKIDSHTNSRIEEGDQRGLNESQLKLLKKTWHISQHGLDTPLFYLG